MDFENQLQFEGKEDGTLNRKDIVEGFTEDTDISKVDETLDIDSVKLANSSDKQCSATYEKLEDVRPSEEKIYDKIKKRRMSKYFNFQLPAKKYVFSLIVAIGIASVVLILVITLASQTNEDGNICEHPSEIKNGEAKNLTGLRQGDTYKLNCKDGYRVSGELDEINDTTVNDSVSPLSNDGQSLKIQQTITCIKNGQWSNIPHCEPVSCGEPILPGHAHIIYIRGITYQSAVLFGCKIGFEMIGKPLIFCQGNGTWSASPSCSKVVDGGFSMWTSWNKCSLTCGYGSQNRTRSCTNPVPQFGGRVCEGEHSQLQICNITECPVDGGFTVWTSWSYCSVTCAQGTQMRTRACINPKPQYGGADCVGERRQGKTCTLAECPINGSFTLWTSWGQCSETCSKGTQWRYRYCTNPAPQNGGADCVGDRSQGQTCEVAKCPIDGNFTMWSSWSGCSVACGGGTQDRSRSCTNPIPRNGGKDCVGDSTEIRACSTTDCPTKIDGNFTMWSSWSGCSVTCGGGTQDRSRSCTNPIPRNGGKDCVGDSTEIRACSTTYCPTKIDGGYSAWTSWSACSMSVNKSVQTRVRNCNNPPPKNGGANCVGERLQVRDCILPY